MKNKQNKTPAFLCDNSNDNGGDDYNDDDMKKKTSNEHILVGWLHAKSAWMACVRHAALHAHNTFYTIYMNTNRLASDLSNLLFK